MASFCLATGVGQWHQPSAVVSCSKVYVHCRCTKAVAEHCSRSAPDRDAVWQQYSLLVLQLMYGRNVHCQSGALVVRQRALLKSA